jgi:hypothetical protein
MRTPIDLIRFAAERLGDLRDEVTFLGGAVVGLLVTDPAAREPRVTQDVDVVVELASTVKYHLLEESLRRRGFQNVLEGPICRFRHDFLILDVMPTSPEILGFGNRWYADAHRKAVPLIVGGFDIRVVTTPYFLATKLDAFDSPGREGHGDYFLSRDIEDLITVIDGRPEVVTEFAEAPDSVRLFLTERFGELLIDPFFPEGVSAHLDPDSASQRRAHVVLDRIRQMSATNGN